MKKKGFTIIEVVLVLAIAGLIFLMVFLALPALQRSQRDTARKNTLSTVTAAITSYMGNMNGQLPAAKSGVGSGDAFGKYITEVLNDGYTINVIQYASGGSAAADTETIVIVRAAQCGASGTNSYVSGTARQAAAFVKLESGSGATYYCENI